MTQNKHLYYTRTSRPFGPLVLVVAFSLHRGLRPLPPPKKFPDNPKYPEALKNVKKKNQFFSQKFPKFCQSLFENFVPENFFEKKKFTNPPKRRETSRK